MLEAEKLLFDVAKGFQYKTTSPFRRLKKKKNTQFAAKMVRERKRSIFGGGTERAETDAPDSSFLQDPPGRERVFSAKGIKVVPQRTFRQVPPKCSGEG
jgi:hypothetical protein